MGADYVLCFLGVVFEIEEDDKDTISGIESRKDTRIRDARSIGLHTHFCQLTEGFSYLLFVGTEVGNMGPELDLEKSIDWIELTTVAATTTAKLRQIGIEARVELHLQYVGDY